MSLLRIWALWEGVDSVGGGGGGIGGCKVIYEKITNYSALEAALYTVACKHMHVHNHVYRSIMV